MRAATIPFAFEDSLIEWQRLPEPAQHAESELRSAAAAQLNRAAELLTAKTPREQIELRPQFEASNHFALHRAILLQRLVTQAQAVARELASRLDPDHGIHGA
jgi:hypothetical protein